MKRCKHNDCALYHGKPYKSKVPTGEYMMKNPGVYRYYPRTITQLKQLVLGREDTEKATFSARKATSD